MQGFQCYTFGTEVLTHSEAVDYCHGLKDTATLAHWPGAYVVNLELALTSLDGAWFTYWTSGVQEKHQWKWIGQNIDRKRCL